VALLELLVAHAGVAVDRARRLDEERRRAELVVTGAHELTHPLRAILGYSRLLEQKLSGQAGEAESYAAIVRQEATRLSRMVAGLVDLAGAEPSKLGWTAVSVQVKDVAQTAAAQIQPLAEINGVELVLRVPSGLPTLFGNRERLIQAATSLLATAVSLSGAGGQVVLRVTSTASDATVSQALRALRPARDPLLPEPAVGYELCADAPVRLDVESLPKPPADPAAGHGRTPTVGTARDSVFLQLGRKDAPAAAADVGRKDPALTIAQQVVRHHGGTLWAERLSGGGTRLSMAFASLEQRDDGTADPR
jgi:signal transduction histidine kinase